MAAGSKNSIVFGSSFCHRQACGTDGVTEVWESLLFHRCQTSSCARHESRAVRRHHEDHRPEHIEGEQAPGGKRPKGASSRLSLAAPGRLEPFQRACSATVPEKSLRCAIFPNFRLESGRNGGRGFYESITIDRPQNRLAARLPFLVKQGTIRIPLFPDLQIYKKQGCILWFVFCHRVPFLSGRSLFVLSSLLS